MNLDPATARCGRCQQSFELPCKVTIHKETPFHENCWTCVHCGRAVSSQFYIDPATPDEPWCVDCYGDQQMTCKVCQGKIPPNVLHFPEGSQFGGPKHVACVRCVWCQGPLGANGATEFYPHEGDIYCSSICLSSKLAIARGSGPPRTDLAWKGPASQSGEGSTQVAASTTAGPFLASAATPTPTSVTAPALASVASPAPTSAAVSFRSLVVITPKFDVCLRCQKKVYQYELVKVNGTIFHKFCLRCKVCSTTLSVKSAEMLGSEVYCKVHLPGNKALGSATVN